MLYVVTPNLNLRIAAVETVVVGMNHRGALCETTAVSRNFKAGLVEQTAVPVQVWGAVIEACALEIFIDGTLVYTLTVVPAPTESFSAYVMNTNTLGVGTYVSFPMRSLFPLLVGGVQKMFGISAEGIHKFVDGQDDNGSPIQAVFVSGVSNLGEDKRKWVTDAYIECRCSGRFQVTIIYDERESYTCVIDPDVDRQGLHFKRIKLPRGVDATHIQIKVENQDGADFDMQSIRLITVPKTRRIG